MNTQTPDMGADSTFAAKIKPLLDCLSCQYTAHPVMEEGLLNGYRIRIIHDSDAENPWVDWDGQPPIVVMHDRADFTEYGFTKTDCYPELTRQQIKENWRDLVPAAYSKTWKTLREFLQDYAPARYNGQTLAETFNEALLESLDEMYWQDKLELYGAMWNAAGVPAEVKTVRGSCQSDWAKVLVVLTPEWQEITGCKVDDEAVNQSNMESAARLYEAWAFGDTAGFVIGKEEPHCECCGAEQDDEEVDSCWGFYGLQNSDARNVDYSGIYADIWASLPEDAKTERAL